MEYRIVEGWENMEVADVARLLWATYWASGRTMAQIERAMRHSSCYGVYVEGAEGLAGFARVITDFATSYYLCDVVIDPAFRGQGLGTALVRHVVSRPEFDGLRGMLITRDAHDLYRKFGFEVLDGRFMVKALKC